MTYALRIRRRMEARIYDPVERVRAMLLRQESEARAYRIALALIGAAFACFALALAI